MAGAGVAMEWAHGSAFGLVPLEAPAGYVPPAPGPVRYVPMTPEEAERFRRAVSEGPRGVLLQVEPEPNARIMELLGATERLVEQVRVERRRAERAEVARDLLADDLLAANDRTRMAREAYQVPLPLSEWHEDLGPVLWWFFPVEEAPFCGSPGDSDWPGYHTHWTPLPGVMQPDGTPAQPTRLPARHRIRS
jgi:hypothetical protein